jgi:hypothetical protein
MSVREPKANLDKLEQRLDEQRIDSQLGSLKDSKGLELLGIKLTPRTRGS